MIFFLKKLCIADDVAANSNINNLNYYYTGCFHCKGIRRTDLKNKPEKIDRR